MKFSGTKIFAFLGIVLCSFQFAHAELVWSQDKGWQVRGGVLSQVVGEASSVENALDAMNEAKKAQDDGEYWTAISYYKLVAQEFPNSIFAPEAYYQLGVLYAEKNMFSDSQRSFDNIIKNYPDYAKFNLVVGQKYKVASRMQEGARPYLWGWFPWVRNHKTTIKHYESVISNAPFSDYAPMALMNIAILGDDIGEPELAIDALDRLINTYPQSIFASDAYLQMAKTYRNMVQGAAYDQASVLKALDFYQDFLILFPKDAAAANAEEGLSLMQDIHARSRLEIGDFYYQYRDNHKAATIFYNETITLAPNSLAAQEARERLKEIADGVKATMTPADWFMGRYEVPDYEKVDSPKAKEALIVKEFEIGSVEDFVNTDAPKQDTFAPLHGPALDGMLEWDGTFEDKNTNE